MKTILLKTKRHSMLHLGISFLIIIAQPFFAKAQSGENDVTFNRQDKVNSQGANDWVRLIKVQPDNKIFVLGSFTRYNGTQVNELMRLNTDGSLDEKFKIFPANLNVTSVAFQSDNKILIGCSQFDKSLVRLFPDGKVDKRFNADIDSREYISRIIIQPDEKILVLHDGILSRLHKNGSRDLSFYVNPDDITLHLSQIALQPDGKIVIAGTKGQFMVSGFSTIRLNKDGSRDSSFAQEVSWVTDSYLNINDLKIENDGGILLCTSYSNHNVHLPFNGGVSRIDKYGHYVNGNGGFSIYSILIQPDGKIICSGVRNVADGIRENEMIRFNKDFTIDSTFTFKSGDVYKAINKFGGEKWLIAADLQQDGKILIGGVFEEVDGLVATNIARLNSNGDVDVTFNQRTACNGTILTSAVQANGKTIIAGKFSRYDYHATPNIARLKENGRLDPSFNVGSGTNGEINNVAVQPDGRVVIAGRFTSYDGYPCSNIVRLNKNGSLDKSFENVVTDNFIRKVAIDKNGKIILAGDFKTINGIPRMGIGRLLPDGTLDNAFNSCITGDTLGRVYDFVLAPRGRLYAAVNYRNEEYVYTRKVDVIRLNRNGTRDTRFKALIPEFYLYELVSITLNNSSKPIVSADYGYFYKRAPIIQFNLDGSIDSSFHSEQLTDSLDGIIRKINVLKNDKIVIAGDFTGHIKLLDKDASINSNFTGTANNTIYTTTLVGTDKMIVGGIFSEYGNIARNSIARINVEIAEDERISWELFASAASEDKNRKKLDVYPNPAATSISLNNLLPGCSLKVMNYLGTEMYTSVVTNEKQILDVSAYSNGVYFIVMESNGNRSVAKFIVNK